MDIANNKELVALLSNPVGARATDQRKAVNAPVSPTKAALAATPAQKPLHADPPAFTVSKATSHLDKRLHLLETEKKRLQQHQKRIDQLRGQEEKAESTIKRLEAQREETLKTLEKVRADLAKEVEIVRQLEQEAQDDSTIHFTDPHLCKICYQQKMCRVFEPCCHMVCCATCAQDLTECPTCRSRISAKKRVIPA